MKNTDIKKRTEGKLVAVRNQLSIEGNPQNSIATVHVKNIKIQPAEDEEQNANIAFICTAWNNYDNMWIALQCAMEELKRMKRNEAMRGNSSLAEANKFANEDETVVLIKNALTKY